MHSSIPREQMVSKTKASKELYRLARHGTPEEVKALAADVVDVDIRANKDENNRTSLMHAAAGRRVENVRVLLEVGADVRCIDRNGRSALHWVCLGHSGNEHEKAMLAIIKLLKSRGIDVHHRDNEGKTAAECLASRAPYFAKVRAAIEAPVEPPRGQVASAFLGDRRYVAAAAPAPAAHGK